MALKMKVSEFTRCQDQAEMMLSSRLTDDYPEQLAWLSAHCVLSILLDAGVGRVFARSTMALTPHLLLKWRILRMHRPQKLLFALAFSTMTAVSSYAWAAGFENIVVSTEEDADATQDSFAADTPKIFVSAELTKDVPSGSKVNIAWIAIDTGGVAPPNYKIDEVNLDITSMINHVNSALSKPNNGWPVGTYKIEFSVDGKPMESVGFSIK
ncbi:hypothetical protein [Rhizobium sp. P44RR-XXIV]|uniref:hypothetical protein n=1 Tax=Rhizobium sp. P44RR-XXIV TaxID=1921145 RepID=UPI001FF05465|nr:hypothetical protein [Rhizobium sp. P44RR-XXIV]